MTQEFIDYLFKFFVFNKDNICDYCKNHKECSENCPKYESMGEMELSYIVMEKKFRMKVPIYSLVWMLNLVNALY